VTRVKICGIRDKAHVLAAATAGADFIGMVFAPSHRRITPAEACELSCAAKKASSTMQVVGVFVNAPASEVNRIAALCALDWVQLSGDESWEYCDEIIMPIIKTIRATPQHHEEIYANVATGNRLFSNQGFITLLDSHAENEYGGTGTTCDWELAHKIARQFPVILAGGLTPENVGKAIKIASPWGVDVSSGVEVAKIKDTGKIQAFINAVRRADDSTR